VKVKHVRESDFQEIELEYPDVQYQLAQRVHEAIQSPYPLVFDDSGGKIFVGYQHPDPNISRLDRDLGVGKYKITIEKII